MDCKNALIKLEVTLLCRANQLVVVGVAHPPGQGNGVASRRHFGTDISHGHGRVGAEARIPAGVVRGLEVKIMMRWVWNCKLHVALGWNGPLVKGAEVAESMGSPFTLQK